MELYFSDQFEVPQATLESKGYLDISLVSDLPLFIDPFLLYNSEKPEYQVLHEGMLKYLMFLRDKAIVGALSPALIRNLYAFKEVHQNWLGFTMFSNRGQGLGSDFAQALHQSLGRIFTNFGEEDVTDGSHLEKLCLIRPGVGRDNISDFTTNLIKAFLLEKTQQFAKDHIDSKHLREFRVARAAFNYKTESWETRSYTLPEWGGDYILLTPTDLLTRDDTWINHSDMIRQFDHIPAAIPDDELREQVNNYYTSRLRSPRRRKPAQKDLDAAAAATIREFPQLVDYYILLKEQAKDQASAVSAEQVEDIKLVLIDQVKKVLGDLIERTDILTKPWDSYEEALVRVKLFKSYVEDKDGYLLVNRRGQPFAGEKEVQLFFGLIWQTSIFDVNREANNGRGPVDFKVSFGAGDKSLIEFKLGKNTALKRNLQKQTEIYAAANDTKKVIKVIICYTLKDQERVKGILKELDLQDDPSIVVIDARNDNKPSGSKA